LEPEVIHTPARVLLIICMVLQKRKMTKRRNVQGTGIEEFEGFVQEVKVGESKEDRQTRRRRRRRRNETIIVVRRRIADP